MRLNYARRFASLLLLIAFGIAVSSRTAMPAVRGADAWQLGPFTKTGQSGPVLSPGTGVFECPIRRGTVAWEQSSVFNPAAILRDGMVCLLYRAEDGSGNGIGTHTSRIGLATSRDGIRFQRRQAPVLFPAPDAQQGNEWPGGCEDPRIVEAADGRYILTYTQWNRQTARLAVATSRDLVHWVKHGPAFASAFAGRFRDQWSKSGAIVTRLAGDRLIATHINGRYWMYWGDSRIYAATSTDLIHWNPVLDADNRLAPVLSPRAGRFDSTLVESGPPALRMGRGILLLYNGRNDEANGDTRLRPGAYSAGQVLLDNADPTRVLARSDAYFLTPDQPWETSGQYTGGTVFVEGLIHWKQRWWLYYGTADSKIAVATCEDSGL